MSAVEIPLFPLNTVLFPGGPLPLRIFEPRYLDMVSRCIRENAGFGVCLIREGREVGETAVSHELGTLATIVDWDRRPDGLLGITAVGQQRIRVQSVRTQPDKLAIARVELLPEEGALGVPGKYLPLIELLRRMMEQVGPHYEKIDMHFEDAVWLGYRLAELLPVSMEQKQAFLQQEDAMERLDTLWRFLDGLDVY